jgi:TrmH family RNA methyltransferase
MPDSVLNRVRVILFEPQDPVNIAATVRAMKNMGLSSLCLVRSVTYDPYRIAGIAHDTLDLIERIKHVDTLEDAVADCVYVAAFTARRRAAKWPLATPRECAAAVIERAQEGQTAIVFGREDKGLPNDALDRAHLVVTIPTTEHASLNLAQAVVVALYELHIAAGDATRTLAPPRKDAPPATAAELELFYADAQRALEAIDFFKTRYPQHVMRSLRSLTARAAPDSREASLIRAMAIEVVRTIDRITPK